MSAIATPSTPTNKESAVKRHKKCGIEFILSNADEKSSFENYCRYKGIKLGLLKQDDWNIILPSIVALRNAHKSHIAKRANNDERFSNFVAKIPPRHLDKAFDTIQSYLSSLQPAAKVEIVQAKSAFTKWCESFARQIHLQNTPQTPLESTTQTNKQHDRVVELYQEVIYLYQGIYHLMARWLRNYIPPSFIESLLKDNQQRIKEIGDELQALEAGFDSRFCQIQDESDKECIADLIRIFSKQDKEIAELKYFNQLNEDAIRSLHLALGDLERQFRDSGDE